MRIVIPIAVALTTVLAMVMLISIPSTDDFDPQNPLWNGLSALVSEYGVKTIDLRHSSIPPTVSTVLVIGPSTPFSRDEVAKLKRFVYAGGKLVVMDDFGTATQLLRSLGITIEIYRGVLTDPLYFYKSYRFPRVRILNITTFFNYGTAIRSWSRGVCIGYSSGFSFIDKNLNGLRDKDEPVGPLCVALLIRMGRGEIIYISDADIAINSMINLNREILSLIIEKGRTVLIVGHLVHRPYTIVRRTILNAFSIAINTSLRYPLLALISVAIYVLTTVLYRGQRGPVCSDRYVDEIVRNIIARHPNWDRDEVRKFVRERVCRESSRS